MRTLLTPEERQQLLHRLKRLPHLAKREGGTMLEKFTQGEREVRAAERVAEAARVGVNQQAAAQGPRAEKARMSVWRKHEALVAQMSRKQLGLIRRQAEVEAQYRGLFKRTRQRPLATSPSEARRTGPGQPR